VVSVDETCAFNTRLRVQQMSFYKGTAGMKQYANKGTSPGSLQGYPLLDEML